MTNRRINKDQNEWVTFTYSTTKINADTHRSNNCTHACHRSRVHSINTLTYTLTHTRVSMGHSVCKLDLYVCVFFLTQHSRELSIFIMIQSSVPAAVSRTQRDYTVWYWNRTIKNTMYGNEMKHEHCVRGKARLHGYKDIDIACWY